MAGYDRPQRNDVRRDRRSIRLPQFDYAQPGAYFVTIVTAGRIPMFGTVDNGQLRPSPAGEIARDGWAAIPAHFPSVSLDAFVVMPNHLHGILIHRGVGARHAVPIPRPATQVRHHTTALGVEADGRRVDVPGEGARHAVPLRDGNGDIGWDGTTDDGAVGGSERFGRPAVGTIPTIVRSFKAAVARQINVGRGTPGAPVWQRNYYEHIIRNDESLRRIRRYIADNPRQWDLDRLNGSPLGSR